MHVKKNDELTADIALLTRRVVELENIIAELRNRADHADERIRDILKALNSNSHS